MHWLTVLEVSHLKFSYYLWAENLFPNPRSDKVRILTLLNLGHSYWLPLLSYYSSVAATYCFKKKKSKCI